jgi:hypothetical protein
MPGDDLHRPAVRREIDLAVLISSKGLDAGAPQPPEHDW